MAFYSSKEGCIVYGSIDYSTYVAHMNADYRFCVWVVPNAYNFVPYSTNIIPSYHPYWSLVVHFKSRSTLKKMERLMLEFGRDRRAYHMLDELIQSHRKLKESLHLHIIK